MGGQDLGLSLDIEIHDEPLKGADVNASQNTRQTAEAMRQERIGNRRKVRVPGRLTWRDATGTLRFVSVVTRDVSDVDAFVECQVPASIPLYRLVHFQVERPARDVGELPPVLQQGKVLSAVYRVGPYRSSTGTPQGYALRLLVEPKRRTATQARPDPMTVAIAN
jgi:hypothetical protein